MKTYCVTGGAGFIGSNVCKSLLAKGHRVINMDNFSGFYDYKAKISNVLYSIDFTGRFPFVSKGGDLELLSSLSKSERYHLYVVDIRNLSAVNAIFQSEKIDAVIHLAAMPGVRPSIENPLLYEGVNIKGTLNILEAMRKFNVRKWIFASSSSVYGNQQHSTFSESELNSRPISPYAATKKACEDMGYSYYNLHGIHGMMMRFFTVYGPRQRPDLAIRKFIKQVDLELEIPVYGDGQTARDYTYIDDTVTGVISAIEYVEGHEVYEIVNIGTGTATSLQTMIRTIEAETGKIAKLQQAPPQAGDVDFTKANIEKASLLLNYSPRVRFSDGISNQILWQRGVAP
ncbi:GDP-mannose 4,6-dehydratase [Gorillibacterium timonense]|uniref:GDP-mannose 4,6-dehydratase n=1 Tax=Gorillibacterium timonense TaxID=1689269 RepID=UPI0009E82CEF|nr:GDP-mannose 4,6-dehydratase [Gorillibacterium timonense]